MPREVVGPEAGEVAGNPSATRCRVGRARDPHPGGRRLPLILGAAVGLACLHIFEPTPPGLPMDRVRSQGGSTIRGFAIGPDGRTIAMADHLGAVTLRSAKSGWGVERSFRARGKPVAFSPDGRHLAIGGIASDVVWCDLQDRPRERTLGIPVLAASDLRFSPDGRTLAVSSHDSPEVIVWDLEAGRARMTLRGHRFPVTQVAFAPDGRELASASGLSEERSVLIWSLATGRPERQLGAANSGFLCIAYSPDGRLLAGSCANEKPVRIWDAQTGRAVRAISGHTCPAQSLAFSPDGRWLATAAGAGFASIWNVATGREVRRLDTQADLLNHIAFSSDGHTLAATGSDGDIRFWDLNELIAAETGS